MDPKTQVNQYTAGYSVAGIVAIILNTLLTWAKESYPPLLAAMKSIAHHWVVHGTVIMLAFFVLGYIFSKQSFARGMNGVKLAIWLSISTVVAGVGLVGYFLVV
ncbi:MAG: hypothetical protein Q7S05_00835 [bacterium]|nr:hypothetical protein [bacterium]